MSPNYCGHPPWIQNGGHNASTTQKLFDVDTVLSYRCCCRKFCFVCGNSCQFSDVIRVIWVPMELEVEDFLTANVCITTTLQYGNNANHHLWVRQHLQYQSLSAENLILWVYQIKSCFPQGYRLEHIYFTYLFSTFQKDSKRIRLNRNIQVQYP